MVFEKVREILCNQFDVEENEVTLTTRIGEDLGADSLDAVDMLITNFHAATEQELEKIQNLQICRC